MSLGQPHTGARALEGQHCERSGSWLPRDREAAQTMLSHSGWVLREFSFIKNFSSKCQHGGDPSPYMPAQWCPQPSPIPALWPVLHALTEGLSPLPNWAGSWGHIELSPSSARSEKGTEAENNRAPWGSTVGCLQSTQTVLITREQQEDLLEPV